VDEEQIVQGQLHDMEDIYIQRALILRWWKMRTRRRRTTVTSEVTMAAAGMAWDRVPKVVHVRPNSKESSRFGWINVHTRWNS
jgi:hypothetical protein